MVGLAALTVRLQVSSYIQLSDYTSTEKQRRRSLIEWPIRKCEGSSMCPEANLQAGIVRIYTYFS